MSIHKERISFEKICHKKDLPLNDSLLTNHFSQHSFCENTQNEALLKSFELEYEIEDKTGDKILLMNFSKKKKLSIDTNSCSNQAKIITPSNENNKKFAITTPTILSMSPKMEIVTNEGEENKISIISNEKKKHIGQINISNLHGVMAHTCPNLKNFDQLFNEETEFLKEDSHENLEFQSYHSNMNHKEYIQHVRNNSWESFTNLINHRRNHPIQYTQNLYDCTKKTQDQIIFNEKEAFETQKDCFSFANKIQESENHDSKTIYVHIPGYLKDEVKEQEFIEVQKNFNSSEFNINEKKEVLKDLYSIQNKSSKRSITHGIDFKKKTLTKDKNKKAEVFYTKKEREKTEAENSEKIQNKKFSADISRKKILPRTENKENVQNFENENEKPNIKQNFNFFKKYQNDINYFEEARKFNQRIELLEKQIKGKCF